MTNPIRRLIAGLNKCDTTRKDGKVMCDSEKNKWKDGMKYILKPLTKAIFFLQTMVLILNKVKFYHIEKNHKMSCLEKNNSECIQIFCHETEKNTVFKCSMNSCLLWMTKANVLRIWYAKSCDSRFLYPTTICSYECL